MHIQHLKILAWLGGTILSSAPWSKRIGQDSPLTSVAHDLARPPDPPEPPKNKHGQKVGEK
eukprot:2410785-Amphidinium_carterae.1